MSHRDRDGRLDMIPLLVEPSGKECQSFFLRSRVVPYPLSASLFQETTKARISLDRRRPGQHILRRGKWRAVHTPRKYVHHIFAWNEGSASDFGSTYCVDQHLISKKIRHGKASRSYECLPRHCPTLCRGHRASPRTFYEAT